MYYTLTKSQKKIARRIMDKGLDNDYKMGLKLAADITERWKNGTLNNKEAYMKLFKSIDRTDNMIARRYNGKGGSRWVEVMADQLAGGAITEEDISEFDEKLQNDLLRYAGIMGYDE
ncbi:MAG: hypothetical protein KAI29_22410 [Cyclobacteriaceae bacterium]|nr:hypothetical protein [Cyclobacteriaceae bacterium]